MLHWLKWFEYIMKFGRQQKAQLSESRILNQSNCFSRQLCTVLNRKAATAFFLFFSDFLSVMFLYFFKFYMCYFSFFAVYFFRSDVVLTTNIIFSKAKCRLSFFFIILVLLFARLLANSFPYMWRDILEKYFLIHSS